MKKLIYACVIILLCITAVQVLITQDRTEQKTEMEANSSATSSHEDTLLGGGFTLTNQDGKIVQESDFHGRVMLVSFGFTHCPDICPVTVATLSKTMELMGDKADSVAPLFISVDPQRDTPQVLKEFLSNFDKHLVGLTGTELQIKQVAEAYKVYYAKSGDGKADYSVDHSGYIYMMAKDGQFLKVFPYNVPAEELAAAVQAALR